MKEPIRPQLDGEVRELLYTCSANASLATVISDQNNRRPTKPLHIKLTVVEVVVSSEGTDNNCLFVEVFNWFLDFRNEIFDFPANSL